MKQFYFIVGYCLIFLASCLETNLSNYKFPLDENNIFSGYLILDKHQVELSKNEIKLFISKIQNSKNKGLIKGIVSKKIELITSNNEIITYRLLKNVFKDNFNGDNAFEINDTSFIKEFINIAEKRGLVYHQKSIINLITIFEDYKTNEEAIESEENKNLVTKSLKDLNPSLLTEKDIILLIDYWIYYDPTDFNIKSKMKPILLDISKDLKNACLKRKLERHKWEYDNEYFDMTIKELETLK